MTDTVAFQVTEIRWPDRPEQLFLQVTPIINGKSLIEIVREFERPLAVAAENPGNEGGHEGLYGRAVGRRDHYLAEPVETWFEDGDTVLLGCKGCGDWGCWPFSADITVTEDTVRWSHFRQGHRDWNYSGLGPWEFNRDEYDAALEAIPLAERTD